MTATFVSFPEGHNGCTTRPGVVLCLHCADQRKAEPSGPRLVAIQAVVTSGCCHDCGAGWCLCAGRLPCELCPRKNAPAVLLTAPIYYAFEVPPPPSTIPAPIGRGR